MFLRDWVVKTGLAFTLLEAWPGAKQQHSNCQSSENPTSFKKGKSHCTCASKTQDGHGWNGFDLKPACFFKTDIGLNNKNSTVVGSSWKMYNSFTDQSNWYPFSAIVVGHNFYAIIIYEEASTQLLDLVQIAVKS